MRVLDLYFNNNSAGADIEEIKDKDCECLMSSSRYSVIDMYPVPDMYKNDIFGDWQRVAKSPSSLPLAATLCVCPILEGLLS